MPWGVAAWALEDGHGAQEICQDVDAQGRPEGAGAVIAPAQDQARHHVLEHQEVVGEVLVDGRYCQTWRKAMCMHETAYATVRLRNFNPP